MKLDTKTATLALTLAAAAALQVSCGDSDDDGTGQAQAGGTGGTAGAGGIAGSGGSAGETTDAGDAAQQTLPTCAGTSSDSLAFAPTDTPFGVTYEEWGQRWQQWALALPLTDHPNWGGPCDQAQTAPAWFLGTARPGSSTRTCTVPADVGLLVTVASLPLFEAVEDEECLYGQCPAPEEVYQSFCEEYEAAWIGDLCLEVDGVAVANLEQYHYSTGLFRAALNPDDPIYTPDLAGPYRAAAGNCPGDCAEGTDRHIYQCGYWVMLPALSPGQHTIRLHNIQPPDPTREPATSARLRTS